jgi:pimeloyl-ACP methyl ester carboxylesterase
LIFDYKNLKINYEIFDNREDKNSIVRPLLLLHGWMAKIEAWAPVYLYFSKTRPVYVVDFPGQAGKSSKLTDVWGVPEYSEMIKEFIESLNIKGIDVIGHSFGGRVIIFLSSKYHDLFNKIILTDSAGVKPKTSLKKSFKILSYKFMKNVLKVFLSKDKYEKKLEEMRQKRGSKDYSSLSDDTMRQSFKQIINLDLTPNLKDITNSTLLVWGENDTDTPLYMAKIMENKITDSGLVVLENAGHFSYLDNTQKYLLVADNFLNS